MNDNHKNIRRKEYWTSYGKYGEDAPIVNVIAELSDSHLMRIVYWLRKKKPFLSEDTEHRYTLNVLEDEIEYRSVNKIFVSDSY